MRELDYQNKSDSKPETGLLRKWFGPSHSEVWQRLAGHVEGRYEKGHWFWGGDKVTIDVGEWTITLDVHVHSTGKSTVSYTRLRAPYVNRDGLRFTVFRRHMFSWLAEIFGTQDVQIGDAQFDHDFVIKSNNESQARRLFQDQQLRTLLAAQKDVQFTVRDDEGWFGTKFPEGVDELQFMTFGVIKDIVRLRELYDLFALTLNRLCAIGSAYEHDPGVELK